MEPSNGPTTTSPPANPTATEAPLRRALKITGLILLLIAYTAVVAFGSVWGYNKHEAKLAADQQNAINPHQVVQQALINNLSTNSFHRHITYRDNLDRSMLVTWDMDTDISNPRDPKTAGTLSINYIKDKQTYTQVLDFISLEAKSGRHTVYARMIKGNEVTSAPKEWFIFDFYRPYYFDPYNKTALFYRDKNFDMFSSNPKASGFQTFTGFDLSQYNSPATYVVTANMRTSTEKAKIVSEIQNDKAYVLQNCDKNEHESWCSGSTNSGGISSIDINLATSEGLGQSPGLNFEAVPFWLTADNQPKQLRKLEISSYGGDKYVTEFTDYNKKLSIAAPSL